MVVDVRSFVVIDSLIDALLPISADVLVKNPTNQLSTLRTKPSSNIPTFSAINSSLDFLSVEFLALIQRSAYQERRLSMDSHFYHFFHHKVKRVHL